jgi:hypothetical protein
MQLVKSRDDSSDYAVSSADNVHNYPSDLIAILQDNSRKLYRISERWHSKLRCKLRSQGG